MATSSTTSDEDIDERFAEIIAAEWPKLTGRQTPFAQSFQVGSWELGEKVVELARRMMVRTMPWQTWSIEKIMAKNPDGTWTHPECCLIVPRQNGKSLILSLVVIYRMFKLGEQIIFSAQQWETAKSLWKRTWNMVRSHVDLLSLVESHTCSQGRGTIVLKSGAQVVFTTRSPNAARGLDRIDLAIYDEAYDLDLADLAALSPTQMAAPDPQSIYTSTAVNAEQQPNGMQLASVRARGLDHENRLFYAEWRAPDDAEMDKPETWRIANPAYGVIANEDKLSAEWRKFRKTEAGRKSFGCEYLGIGEWPTEGPEELPPVVDSEAWEDLKDLDAVAAGASCIAVECETVRDPSQRRARRWSIGAAVRTSTGKHLQLGYRGPGSPSEIARKVAEVVGLNDPVAVVIDSKSIAKDLLTKDLIDLGIEPEFVKAGQVSQATNGFLQGIDGRTYTHDGDPRVGDVLKRVQLREIGQAGGAAWERPKNEDIAPVIALTNAAWGLDEFDVAAVPPPPAPEHEPATANPNGGATGGVDFMTASF
ncbi:putative phage associated protein [Dietzia alimentaria]|uniref:putative phage associated protein n=1 Tax=Dietzia alimentaria TaxID=665550 RepID=UPI00029AAB9B|nr:putative phage associated protein [Dietzia alimentaria]